MGECVNSEIRSDELQDENSPWNSHRLQKNVYPQKYSLFIYPQINSGTFSGEVSIDILVSEPTKYILVHQTNLNISNTKLTAKSDDSENYNIEKTWAFPQNHYWVIQLLEELQPGNYELFMAFKGTLASCTLGLYKSTYSNVANEQSSCVLSYFEATYARSAFPCFDEPSFRAPFYIKIAHDATGDLVALSNMCREKETLDYPSPGVNTVHFRPTPPMPPYLIAIIVGGFLYTKPIYSKNNVSVAVYSRPDIISDMTEAQRCASFCVDFFTDYFQIPYNLPKLDLIGYPDSNIGGMENWGMISFREDLLIVNDTSTFNDCLDVVGVICHEISHMWFGDLVTISWWDNVWLKEGFANHMGSLATKSYRPDLYSDWINLSQMYSALKMDAALNSHPIVQPVNTTAEIREVFDAISYCKGSCLIRMLEDIDPKGFQEGVKSYLDKYKFTSTVTQNLWDQIQEKVSFDVSSFMDTWTKQMGFPVLHVQRIHGTKYTVSQSRFLLSKNFTFDHNKSPFKYKWNVPIKYVTSDDLKNVKLTWLNMDQESVALDCSDVAGWVKLNWHQVGFYRVNYPQDLWDLFSLQLLRNPSVFDVEDRAHLIDDSFSLASAAYFHYHVPLNILQYLKTGKEKHFFPWEIAKPHLEYIGARFSGTEGHALFLEYVHLLLKDNLTEKIWDFEAENLSGLEIKLRLSVIILACWSEHPEALKKIKQFFEEWLYENKAPYHELRPTVYSYGLASGVSEEVWEKVLNMALETKDVTDKFDLWMALGNVRNENYLKRLIELAKDEKNLVSQNFFLLMNKIALHRIGLEVVWNFLRSEWEYLVNRFTLEDPKFCSCVFQTCSQFGTAEKLAELKEFYKKYPEAGAGARAREMALEKVALNVEWSSRNYQPIREWLGKLASGNDFNPDLEKLVVL